MNRLLVADIGGTNARIALASQPAPGRYELHDLELASTQRDPITQLAEYHQARGGPALAGVAVAGAGPVEGRGDDAHLQLTNHAARLSVRELSRRFAVPVALLNDFAAVAHCVPALGQTDVRALGGADGWTPVPDAAHAVIGPGTGLGMAALVPVADDYAILPGEGGHADLPLRSPEEWQAVRPLRDAAGRLSAEGVLCGSGLARLHAALAGAAAPLEPSEVARLAFEKNDAAAAKACALFTRLLGRVAGNFALAAGARAGVSLAGGIVVAWGRHFDAQAFRAAFEDNDRQAKYLRKIPTRLITAPQPALLGLARFGFASFRH